MRMAGTVFLFWVVLLFAENACVRIPQKHMDCEDKIETENVHVINCVFFVTSMSTSMSLKAKRPGSTFLTFIEQEFTFYWFGGYYVYRHYIYIYIYIYLSIY